VRGGEGREAALEAAVAVHDGGDEIDNMMRAVVDQLPLLPQMHHEDFKCCSGGSSFEPCITNSASELRLRLNVVDTGLLQCPQAQLASIGDAGGWVPQGLRYRQRADPRPGRRRAGGLRAGGVHGGAEPTFMGALKGSVDVVRKRSIAKVDGGALLASGAGKILGGGSDTSWNAGANGRGRRTSCPPRPRPDAQRRERDRPAQERPRHRVVRGV
jgi:hypothetical protein